MQQRVFAIRHIDSDVVRASRSGGIFTAVSDYVLSQNGIIYGCILNENYEAVHIRATDYEMRNKMRGSKYVQSNLANCFIEIIDDLKQNKVVLFSGTACQIAGLLSLLKSKKVDVSRLLTMEILCHGVPSPEVWQSNLRWVEKKIGKKLLNVSFRNKTKYGWKRHVETYYFNGEEFDSGSFTKLFTRHYILRPACFKCPYKGTVHQADLTIADFWGIEKVAEKMADDRGVSLVLVNTSKGLQYLNEVRSCIEIVETTIEKAMQPPLVAPFPCPANREQFWQDFMRHGYKYSIIKYASYTKKQRIIDSLPYLFRNILRTKRVCK